MTAQITDGLRYDGQVLAMSSLPLDEYFALAGIDPERLFFGGSSFNWRGYVGSWEIANDRLYLVGLQADGRRGSSLATLFPGFPDRVFAHWFSGTICASRGELLEYVHSGYDSVYEEDLFFEFDQGVLREVKIRQNGKVDPAHSSEIERVGAMFDGDEQPIVMHKIVREADGKFLAPLANYGSRTYVDDPMDAWLLPNFDIASKVCVEGDRIVPLAPAADLAKDILPKPAQPYEPKIELDKKAGEKEEPEPEELEEEPEEEPERVFAVGRGDLLQRMSVEEIEQRERVVDPMGAVPDLPFGHLHAAWKKFSDGIEPQDEFWSFSAKWKPGYWGDELRSGYVIGRGNELGQHFITKIKYIPDPAREEAFARARARRLSQIAGAWKPE
jgi:hypothetical protein